MATEGSQRSGTLAQQGSLDWVALSKTTVSFSVELLARYARAGVEALTIAVGQALFAQFRVPADAQKRLELSVSRLKAYSSAANALWFGIGFKHLIRTLMESEQGATFVAVSSCLMVSYDNEFSATVLKTLCDKSSMPERITPSLSQWGAFIKLSAAAVTASQFPILVEGFSRLLTSSDTRTGPQKLAATSPIELATALLELAQLSTGKVANVTLTGNGDCGWLAALAEWLFSLRVEIIDQTGNSLYQSKGGNYTDLNYFQLTVIRLEEGQINVPRDLLHSRTHLVPPGDLCFNTQTATSYHSFYQGRSEWSTILNDTFGLSFTRLLSPEIIPMFAKVLYSGLSVNEQKRAYGRMNPWGDVLFAKDSSTQHQHRFRQMLQFAAARLPELTELGKYGRERALELEIPDMERHDISSNLHDVSHGSAKGRLILSGFSTALIDACSCNDCNKSPSSQSDAPILRYLCLSKIATTVFEFIWCLSWLDIDDTIRPSSTGLMSLYANDEKPTEFRSLQCLDIQGFSRAVMVLTGFESGLVEQSSSAVVVHGLCVYRASLEHPNIGVEGQYRLRIVPGQIERHEKLYSCITETRNPWIFRPREKKEVDLNETISTMAILGARPQLQIAVEETFDPISLTIKLAVVPETKTRIHWNFLYRPFLDREVQLQYQESCFLCGPVQLASWMRGALNHGPCKKTHQSTVKNPIWAMHGPVEPWSGYCSLMDLPWWTEDPGIDGRLPSNLQPNEWIVAVRDGFDTLRVVRGSPTLLYCILDRLGTNSEMAFLLQSGDCLVCILSEKLFTMKIQLERLFVISPVIGGKVQRLEFQPRSDRMSIQMELPT